MRRPPRISEFQQYPVTSGTILLAAGVTLAWWSGRLDIHPLLETVDIRRGQIWRIVTSALPHSNILHLAFNIYWTWVFGTLIEGTFGPIKTFAIYVLLAIAGNGAEYALLIGGIGLSGVGYGMFGMLWVLSRRDSRFAGVIDRRLIRLFVAWYVLCVF